MELDDTAPARRPVADWARDFDHLDPAWTRDPVPIWAALREACPVAQTGRFGGAYLPTRYADIRAIAYDVEHFSSRQVVLRDQILEVVASAAPMTADPPEHRSARMALMSAFGPSALARVKDLAERVASERVGELALSGRGDAMAYVRQVVARITSEFLGVPARDRETVHGWIDAFVFEGAHQVGAAKGALDALDGYFAKQIARRRYAPGDGVLGDMVRARDEEGRPLSDAFIAQSLRLLALAGIDTTASVTGSAIWHLAAHPGDRAGLLATPDLLDRATDEFLRLYAPIMTARVVTGEADIGGTRLEEGRRVLMCFSAANRDPDVFPEPDRFDPGREPNPHLAFGIGIHRCIGAGVARAIVSAVLRAWLARIPAFGLDPGRPVTWTSGSVRGPAALPLVWG